MNKMMILVLSLMISLGSANAQKYGHLNFGTLISLMPESEIADKELEDLQKELVAKGEEMATAFQAGYQQFLADRNSGNFTPLQLQEKQTALQKQQQNITKYEKDITDQLGKKRDELLAPIVQQAELVIAGIAKEKGYQMVFDTSMFNSVLFAAESEDLMPLALGKLGIKVDDK